MRHWTELRSTTTHFALASLCLALLFGCKKGTDGDDASKEESKATPEVTLTKVERADLALDLQISGNLAATPNHDAKVSATAPGRIVKVYVNDGDEVSTGQVLGELDNGLLLDGLHQAEAALSQAKANLENAKLASAREDDLLQRGISARKEVEDAHTQVSVTEGAVKQAEAALNTAKTQLSRTTLRAPIDGTVVKHFASNGEQLDGTPATPLVEIADISQLEVLGTVPAARLSEIKLGEVFNFISSSFPDEKFNARVVSILPAVDPGTNNGTVRIRVDNPRHLLKIGMYITVALPIKGSGPRIIVARQAVYPDEAGEPHIYKVTGDTAEAVAVQLGASNKDKIELVSGAAPGDTVVLTGGYGLPEKSKVKVKQ